MLVHYTCGDEKILTTATLQIVFLTVKESGENKRYSLSFQHHQKNPSMVLTLRVGVLYQNQVYLQASWRQDQVANL